MQQADFERHVGAENICPSITEALERAAEVYQQRHVTSASERNKHPHAKEDAVKV
jgi:hypothetical protein